LSFVMVRWIFTAVLTGLCVWAVFAWPGMMGMRWTAMTKTSVALLVFSTLQVMQGVSRVQLSLLVFALLSAAILSAVKRRLWLAGVLLAIATIKPQLVVLPCAFLIIWSMASPARRALCIGFLATLSTLMLAAEALQRGWVREFVQGLAAYRRYAAGSPLEFVFPWGIAWVLALAVLAMTGVSFWSFREAPVTSVGFQSVLALGLSVATLVMPIGGGYNQILLLPAFMALLATRSGPGTDGLAKLLVWSPWLVVVLPWLAILTLTVWNLLGTPGETAYRLPYMFAFLPPFFVTAAIAIRVIQLRQSGTEPPSVDS
jgi:hypothetical protein